MKKATLVKVIKKILLYVFCIFETAIFIYPFYFVLISCTKKNNDIFSKPFIPSPEIHLENFTKAFSYGIGRQFLNSTILSVGTVVLSGILSCMISFALSRLRFRGRNFLRVYFVMGMMVPIQSIIVILAYMTNVLNLRDNYLILILLYTAFYMPLSTFIVTGQMNTMPSALEEAAVIDGCSIYQVFFYIIVPLSKNAIATVSVFTFMYTWNDLLTAMILMGKTSMRTISVGLLNFTGAHSSDYGGLMAAILFAILPPFIMYLVMQENLVKGLTSSAVK